MTPGQKARRRMMLARLEYEVAVQAWRMETCCGLGGHHPNSRRLVKQNLERADRMYQRALTAFEALS